MKKIFLVSLLLISISIFSQYKNRPILYNNNGGNFGQNDFKVNALSLFFYGAELGYERIVNPNIGVGATAMIPYGDNARLVIKSNLNYYVSPYLRFYFNNFGPASGFFVEGFALYSDGKYNPNDSNGNSLDTQKNYSALGAGIGIGEKWVDRSGLFFELNAGLGRNFTIPQDAPTSLILIGKIGASVGYRF
jgi:hypothetical protein